MATAIPWGMVGRKPRVRGTDSVDELAQHSPASAGTRMAAYSPAKREMSEANRGW